MGTNDWRKNPVTIENWPVGIDYVLAIDENGTPDLSYLRKCIRRSDIPTDKNHVQFTVSGACFSRAGYAQFKNKIDLLKNKYWVDGKADYKGSTKKVCFHYSEISKKEHPFNILPYDNFRSELDEIIKKANCTIFSTSINKVQHLIANQDKAYHPYNLSMGFILERFCHMLNLNESSGIIMLESRKNKDRGLLKHLIEILDNGHYPNPKEHFRNIKGIYFNPKWRLQDNSQSTYSILEYSDFVGKIIHDYVFSESDGFNRFQLIEDKLYRYQGIYDGWGLKIYPKNNKAASVALGG